MPILIFWVLVCCVVVLPSRFTVYALFASLSVTTLAIVPQNGLFGTSFVPMIVFAPLMVVRMVLNSDSRQLQDTLLNWRNLGLLTGFLVYALAITIFAPRLFGGVNTIGLNTLLRTPLAPSAGNVTQSLYLITSCGVVLGTHLLLLREGGREILGKGLLIGAAAAILTGVLDMLTVGSDILQPLRTASYAIMADSDMAGVRRVVGLQSEASGFGFLTLSYGAMLLFMRPLATLGAAWRTMSALAGLGCLAMAALSTSSGALLGLLILMVLLVLDTARLALGGRTGPDQQLLWKQVAALTALGITVALAGVLYPETVARLYEIFDTAVLQKTASGSFETRNYWNQVSLDGLIATGGFGVGVGSTRASSWVVAVVAGTGVIGSALLAMFIVRAVSQPSGSTLAVDRHLVGGARRALLISFLPAATSATSVDFGVLVAVMLAVLCAIPARAHALATARYAAPAWLGMRQSMAPALRRSGDG